MLKNAFESVASSSTALFAHFDNCTRTISLDSCFFFSFHLISFPPELGLTIFVPFNCRSVFARTSANFRINFLSGDESLRYCILYGSKDICLLSAVLLTASFMTMFLCSALHLRICDAMQCNVTAPVSKHRLQNAKNEKRTH